MEETVKPGDVVVRIDGQPAQKRIEELKRYISASTPQSMMALVMQALLQGSQGSAVRFGVKTVNGPEREIKMMRASSNWALLSPMRTGEVLRLLTPSIGYVDLERLENAQVDAMFEKFKDTEAIILDMRAYPQGTAWSIAPRLAEKPAVVAAQFRRNVVTPDCKLCRGCKADSDLAKRVNDVRTELGPDATPETDSHAPEAASRGARSAPPGGSRAAGHGGSGVNQVSRLASMRSD